MVSGQPGKECVTLVLGGSNATPSPDSAEPPMTEDVQATPVAATASTAPAASTSVEPEDTDGDSAVQLRGLPYRATKADVRIFLGEFASKLASDDAIHLVLNRDGRPSGFARVQFATPEAARQCQDELHLRSMDDRYVEVFLYSERPSRGRQRRGAPDDGVTLGTADGAPLRVANAEAPAVSREQVVRECRAEMADAKNRRTLLSMLGVALSPGARSYLKQMDQGLKHFLAQFPSEFSVEGGKGCEYVTYTPTLNLSEAVGTTPTVTATAPSVGLEPPASPKPTIGPATEATPSGNRGLATPSDWGTPFAAPPTGPGSWMPPWGNVAAAAGNSEANNLWAPPSSWPPVPPPQFWGSWAPPMYPSWGNSAALDAGTAPGTLPGAPCPAPTATEPQTLSLGSALAAPKAVTAASGQGPPPAVRPASEAASGMPPTLASAVRLRGLPFTASEQDVLAFFAQHDIVDRVADGNKAVNLLMRSNGRPSGQAVVQLRDRVDAEIAQRVLHGQWMGSRYIEVFLYGDDPADPRASSNGAAGVSAGMPGLPPATAPPWLPTPPWANMPTGVPGQLPTPGTGDPNTETSWEALFEFLGPEGMMAAASGALPTGKTHMEACP